MARKFQPSTRIPTAMLLLQAVLYAGLSTTAPVASTPGQNITTVPADQGFGPTTISSLVVGVFGTLFGLLSLVPFWLRKMRSSTSGNTRSSDTALDQYRTDNEPNTTNSCAPRCPDSSSRSPGSSEPALIQMDSILVSSFRVFSASTDPITQRMKDNEPPLSFHYVLLSSNVECSGLEVAKLGQGSSYPGNTHTEAENEPTYRFSGAESSLRVNR